MIPEPQDAWVDDLAMALARQIRGIRAAIPRGVDVGAIARHLKGIITEIEKRVSR